MSTCSRADDLRDYAFDELAAPERRLMEEHLSGCGECEAELNELRLTTVALRALPDREIPQRIAFVSDKVFSPSPVARFFQGFWSSAARLGFASACLVAGALVISAYHRPPAIDQKPAPSVDVSAIVAKQVNAAVENAVARVRAEDAQLTKSALEASERKHEEEHRMLMVAMKDSLEVVQKRLGAYTMLASADVPRSGEGQ